MVRELPSLNAVRVFEAAARHQNFSRAAEELNVTQSAVSRQVQHLEAQVGEPLFVRSGPKLSLTPAGRDYLRIVQEGLAVIRRGTAQLFGAQRKPTLTLSVVPSLVYQWLVPRLSDLADKHPDISIRLDPSFRLVDFAVDTDIDAAIRFGLGTWSGTYAEPLIDDLIFPVCSPAVAEQIKSPQDLARQRLMVEDLRYDFWTEWARAAGIDISDSVIDRLSDDFSVQIQAAMQGQGVALGRGLLATEALKAGHLVSPHPYAMRAKVKYFLVAPPERWQETKFATLAKWMQDEAKATVVGLEEFVTEM